MSRYHISDRARSDLDEIWVFIALDSPRAADRLIEVLVQKFRVLARSPEIGMLRSELASSLRSFPVGNYLIFYRPFDQGIEIVRVLHGARDLPGLFE